MREINMDLRVIRTKNSIRNALVELIEEKGFERLQLKILQRKRK